MEVSDKAQRKYAEGGRWHVEVCSVHTSSDSSRRGSAEEEKVCGGRGDI